MLLEALGTKYLERYPDRVPKEEDVPLILRRAVQEMSRTEDDPNRPEQPDPVSRGDHELRDEGTQAHVTDA